MQEVIVYIIGTFVFVYILRKAYKLFTCKSDEPDKCTNCSGCALKDLKKDA
jgi:hypothetical protein